MESQTLCSTRQESLRATAVNNGDLLASGPVHLECRGMVARMTPIPPGWAEPQPGTSASFITGNKDTGLSRSLRGDCSLAGSCGVMEGLRGSALATPVL